MERLPGIVERARPADAVAIQGIISVFADRDLMLPRPQEQISEDINDYFVCRAGGVVVGCAALHVFPNSDKLAEIRAVAVQEEYQRQGLGRLLIEACLEEAKTLGVPKILLLTYEPGYFGRFGFKRGKIETFLDKLYGECSICPKGPPSICGEIAMYLDLNGVSTRLRN